MNKNTHKDKDLGRGLAFSWHYYIELLLVLLVLVSGKGCISILSILQILTDYIFKIILIAYK